LEVDVCPFTSREQYAGVVRYFVQASDAFLYGMGADRAKLPSADEWLRLLLEDHEKPDEQKERVYFAWLYHGTQVGHSSLGNIRAGEDAFIHLHLWVPALRRAGLGTEFFKRSVALSIERFALKRVFCEPRAENLAPNRVLEKAGFTFVRRYRTVPGAINYEQDVNRWVYEGRPR